MRRTRAARERNRSGWLCLAIALGLWATGDSYYTHVFGNDPNPPAPSIADLGYLGFFPFAYAGFILLVRSRVPKLTAAVWLDGITAGLAVGALGAAVVFEIVLKSATGSSAAVATNLAYPLGDMILLALIVGAFSLMSWRPGRAWLILGGGLAVNSVGDSIYVYQVANGTYVPGAFLDATWPIAMALLANAAWVAERNERTIDAEGRALQLIPASCVAIGVGVLVYDHFTRVNVLALSLATATIAAVVGRLALTFRENRRLFELTRSEAVTDALTGLANRRRLITDLGSAIAEATPVEPWLLLLFDLDGFKRYNDTFGHPAGDALLTRLGTKLRAVPPERGAAYRLGGDEFCLLTPASTVAAAELIDASVAALSEQSEGFAIGTSLGAVFIPIDATEATEALREADARLYAHKHQKSARRDRPHEAPAPGGLRARFRAEGAYEQRRCPLGRNRPPPRADGYGARGARPGRSASRRREDRRPRRSAAQTRAVVRVGLEPDPAAHDRRPADPERTSGVAASRRDRPRDPRALGRWRLSGRARGRRHPRARHA